MSAPYRIKTVVAENGERLSLLLDDVTGVPLFKPTAYILTEVRMRNRAGNTVKSHLVAIEAMLIHFKTVGIDIEQRIASGSILELWEVDSLAGAMRVTIQELVSRMALAGGIAPMKSPGKVTSPEALRQRAPRTEERRVDQASAANRMRVVHGYLCWLANHRLSRLDPQSESFARLLAMRDMTLSAIKGRTPAKTGRASRREGLPPEARRALLECIRPDSPENPWVEPAARRRNQLMIELLYWLGLRRGELLAIKIGDINLRDNTITIHRRPDDPDDPRPEQPTAKTLGRIMPLSWGLAQAVHCYLAERRAIRGSRRHPFLFVDTDHGRPLSIRSLSHVFSRLNERHADRLGTITAHVLRHDWNDRFSELMDRRGSSGPDEEKQRSHLMGWREGSGTAALYTKRHTRYKATETSLRMQERTVGEEAGNAVHE